MSPKEQPIHPLLAKDANLPALDIPPEDGSVSSHLAAYELNDQELSKNISYYSGLEAYCRKKEGEWRKTEARFSQEASQKESQKYLEYFDKPHPTSDRPKTVNYVNAQVATDEEVVQLKRHLARSKGQIQEWHGNAESYAIKKMDYLSERKHRRESSSYDPERMEGIPG